MNLIKQIIKDIFTARNGIDYSLTKIGFISAEVAMIYKFITTDIPDYISFGAAVAALLTAMAAKYYVEGKNG